MFAVLLEGCGSLCFSFIAMHLLLFHQTRFRYFAQYGRKNNNSKSQCLQIPRKRSRYMKKMTGGTSMSLVCGRIGQGGG